MHTMTSSAERWRLESRWDSTLLDYSRGPEAGECLTASQTGSAAWCSVQRVCRETSVYALYSRIISKHTLTEDWVINCRGDNNNRLTNNDRPSLDCGSYLLCHLCLHCLSTALWSFHGAGWASFRCLLPCTACTGLCPYSTAWNLASGWQCQKRHCWPVLEATRTSWCS